MSGLRPCGCCPLRYLLRFRGYAPYGIVCRIVYEEFNAPSILMVSRCVSVKILGLFLVYCYPYLFAIVILDARATPLWLLSSTISTKISGLRPFGYCPFI